MKTFIPIIKTLLLLLLSISFYSCEKNENNAPPNRLPDITTTGANTFGCMINGELWIPKVEGANEDEIRASYLEVKNEIFIRGLNIRDNEETAEDLGIFIPNLVEDTLSISDKNHISSYNFNCGGEDYLVETNLPYQLIILNHDKQNLIVSGTFYFTLIREDDDACMPDTLITC